MPAVTHQIGGYKVFPIHVDHMQKASHRYTDFEYIREKLIQKYPGCVVPSLPDKEGVKGVYNKYLGD
jgi:hypothetical protein